MQLPQTIQSQIVEHIIMSSLRISEISQKTGISPGNLSNYIKGSKAIGLKTAEKLGEFFGFRVEVKFDLISTNEEA